MLLLFSLWVISDPMDCSTSGSSVLHCLLEFAQMHGHPVSDAIQPSHPLSSPSHPALNLSQHQGLFLMSQLFASGGQSTRASASAAVLPMNIQGWFPLGLPGLITMQPKWLSRVFSSTIIQKHQFFSVQPSLWSTCHICTWLLEKNITVTIRTLLAKWCFWDSVVLNMLLGVFRTTLTDGRTLPCDSLGL